MATARSESPVLDEDGPYGSVKCPICLGMFSEPKILPCTHIVCRSCLVTLIRTSFPPTTCPVCRYFITDERIAKLPSTMSPEDIADALPTEHIVECLVESVVFLKKPHVCDDCSEEADSFCLDCSKKFCEQCKLQHFEIAQFTASSVRVPLTQMPTLSDDLMPSFQNAEEEESSLDSTSLQDCLMTTNVPHCLPKVHNVQLLSELTPKLIMSQRRNICKEHKLMDNVLDSFCSTHNKMVCYHCIEADHSSCEIITVQEAAARSRKALDQMADHLRQKENHLQQEGEKLHRKQEEMHFKAQEALAKIDSAMDRIQQRLQETHALFNQEMKETEGMPTEEKLARQRKALSDFKAVLPTLLSLASAETALNSLEEFGRETLEEVDQSSLFDGHASILVQPSVQVHLNNNHVHNMDQQELLDEQQARNIPNEQLSAVAPEENESLNSYQSSLLQLDNVFRLLGERAETIGITLSMTGIQPHVESEHVSMDLRENAEIQGREEIPYAEDVNQNGSVVESEGGNGEIESSEFAETAQSSESVHSTDVILDGDRIGDK